jgi:hypothetical protein
LMIPFLSSMERGSQVSSMMEELRMERETL